jgi:replicative DNA helicase
VASSRDVAALRVAKPLAFATGFLRLDAILGGGLRPKGLSILGGQTSMGKSALAMNIATNVARGHGVLVCSLEMTSDELAQRAACGLAGVHLGRVRDRQFTQTEWKRYHEAHVTLGHLPLYIADEPGQTISTIRAKGRRLASKLAREGTRLALIVVDYLQLLKPLPGPKSETREQQVASLSRNLKGVAKDLDVHVLALAQLNAQHESRKADEKRPRLGDLRESKAIANDADVVAFVHRDAYQAERDDRDGKVPDRVRADVIVAKHRGGRTGVAELVFDRPRCRFENLPAGYDAEGIAREGP